MKNNFSTETYKHLYSSGGESAVPIAERLMGIAVDDAFLVDHSSLLVPSHCGPYFGNRIESDKIGDGEINLAQLRQRFLCFISGS